MAKLTDAQAATLQRGVQRPDGLISPPAGAKAHTALALAVRLSDAGLVERLQVSLEDPWYARAEEIAEYYGYRVTADGFEALGIDASEWPVYLRSIDAEPAADGPLMSVAARSASMLSPWDAHADVMAAKAPFIAAARSHDDEATLDARESADDRAAYRKEQESELAADDSAPELANPTPVDSEGRGTPEPDDADQPLVSASDLAASMAGEKVTLRSAADAVLAAWGLIEVDGTLDTISTLRPAVERLKAAAGERKPRNAKPRAQGEQAAPREGSKLELVVGLLKRHQGASVAEVMDAAGWLEHTARSFLATLRTKGGYDVTSTKEGKERIYKIAG